MLGFRLFSDFTKLPSAVVFYSLRRNGNRFKRVRLGSIVSNAPAANSDAICPSAATICNPIASGLTSSARICTEVEIMGQNNVVICHCERHDFCIGCIDFSDQRPVNRIYPCVFQPHDPAWRQIHVNKQLHALASLTSRSSARHAAYRIACMMSSRSRYG